MTKRNISTHMVINVAVYYLGRVLDFSFLFPMVEKQIKENILNVFHSFCQHIFRQFINASCNRIVL